MFAEIFGIDGVIVVIVMGMVLFGSSQIPKLARSLGSAQKEFKQGLQEGHTPPRAPKPKREAPSAEVLAEALSLGPALIYRPDRGSDGCRRLPVVRLFDLGRDAALLGDGVTVGTCPGPDRCHLLGPAASG